MPTNIDRYIRDGLELKRHGRSGAQVRDWLATEGLGPDQVAFVLQQIGKAELKAHAEKDPGAHGYIKGSLGGGLIVGGAALLLITVLGHRRMDFDLHCASRSEGGGALHPWK